MRSAWSNDFLGLAVATGFVLNLFFGEQYSVVDRA